MYVRFHFLTQFETENIKNLLPMPFIKQKSFPSKQTKQNKTTKKKKKKLQTLYLRLQYLINPKKNIQDKQIRF